MLLKTIIPPTQTKMPKQPKPPLPILVEVLTYSNVRHAISHVADRSAAAPRISKDGWGDPAQATRFEAGALYEKFYCSRGDMENRIKEQQLDLLAQPEMASQQHLV